MNVLSLFRPVEVFVFDVDGVMTDGTLQLLDSGELSRRMHIRDGYALQLAVKKGYRVVVITGGRSPLVEKRLQGLGVRDIFSGVTDKRKALSDYLEEHGLKKETVLYMGDDMPDLRVMREAAIAVCPADAVEEIRAICHYVSPYQGGQGCVRDVIEKVLKIQGRWG
jgi:3-deoxy-D-manno-octulosonate 8-phosphate phosphatase (KDO 8-P phosphatase)